MSKIPFILVTGYLGSGKTTFLQNIIDQLDNHHTVGIVQNEFSPIGVDGRELKRSTSNFELLEINRGSVFCVCLLGDFTQSLNKFIDHHQPDMIFLEASGLADPVNLAELLSDEQLQQKLYLHSIWTLVDAFNYNKIKRSVKRSVHQIKVADIILLNKLDLVNESEIKQLKESLKETNPLAKITETQYADIDFTEYLDYQSLFNLHPDIKYESVKPTGLNSCTLKVTDQLKEHDINDFLNDIRDKVYRLKGYVALTNNKTAFVQTSFDQSEVIIRDEISHKTELIGIGPDLKARDLRTIFRKYANQKEYERDY